MARVPDNNVLAFPMPDIGEDSLLMAAAIMDEQGRLFEPDENIEDRREPLIEGGMPFPR